MSSLPLLRVPSEAAPTPLDEQALARAFASFTEAAGSLERSYGYLQAEVGRLRGELEASHHELSRSLDENRRMRQHLDRILESLPCGVLVTAANHAVSLANPEARRLLGKSSVATVPRWIQELLEHGEGSDAEQEHFCDHGEIACLSVRRARIASESQVSILILQDVSQRKRLEQEQANSRRRQALSEMSTLLAHEIRNPLGSLELFAGLLAGSELPAESRRWVEHVQAGLRTLAATVNNVLEFHSQPRPQLAPTDLGGVVQWLHDFLAPLAQQAEVEIHLAHSLDGVRINADRHQLEQVVLNLALNALRFMGGGGVLTISGETSSDSRATLQFSDTGPGISAENLARIFTPGFTTRSGSPGLGLAVCKSIVEQHGGTISVSSSAGHGATFCLEFPLGVSQ